MKKLLPAFTLLTLLSFNAVSSQFLITLDDKHYKQAVVVKPYEAPISPEAPSIPSTPDFGLNDLTTVNYNGNTSFNRSCQCWTPFGSQGLSNGWNYMEMKVANSYNVAGSVGVWLQGNPRDMLNGVSDGQPTKIIGSYVPEDIIKLQFYSGTGSTTTTYNIYNNSLGREYVYLESLDLLD
jgi:hypothetical protein